MHDSTLKQSTMRASRCLGCPDCKGMCRALMELVSVPEVVLHQNVATR